MGCNCGKKGRRQHAGALNASGAMITGFRVYMPAREDGTQEIIPPLGQPPYYSVIDAKQVARVRGGGVVKQETA